MSLFENIKLLHQAELYGDLKQLTSMVLSMCENSGEVEILSLPQKYQCLVYLGDAFFHLGEFKKAESIFRKALHLKKALNKTKGKCGTTSEVTSDVDVKYQLYQCLHQLKQNGEALTVLESINTKQRSAKVNYALAKLYLREGKDRSAITCYKEIVRECPLALEAVAGLLNLGMKGADVAALVMNGLPHGTNCEWLNAWIKAHALLAAKDYSNSVTTFRLMETKFGLLDNVYLLSAMGEARFTEGHYSQALQIFQRVHALDPMFLKNMDLYAFLLAKEKKIKELQGLAPRLLEVTEQAPEPWIAMGYFSLHCNFSLTKGIMKPAKAVYFAQKAFSLEPRSVQALLMKGTALMDLKKFTDAGIHFQEAIHLAPHRLEAYTGLVDCYVANHRLKDATNLAGRAIRTLGTNARTLTLFGSVLSKDPNTVQKAKQYLEKAMKLDPTNPDPVCIMAEILRDEHNSEKGIEMLRKQLELHNSSQLHRLLGQFFQFNSQTQEAIEEYSKALLLDPSNVQAREGLERLEKHNEMVLDGTYDVDVEDMGGSDNDADFDGSDMESTWSETDFS